MLGKKKYIQVGDWLERLCVEEKNYECNIL